MTCLIYHLPSQPVMSIRCSHVIICTYPSTIILSWIHCLLNNMNSPCWLNQVNSSTSKRTKRLIVNDKMKHVRMCNVRMCTSVGTTRDMIAKMYHEEHLYKSTWIHVLPVHESNVTTGHNSFWYNGNAEIYVKVIRQKKVHEFMLWPCKVGQARKYLDQEKTTQM